MFEIYKKMNKGILLYLVSIWMVTFPVSMMGRWNNFTEPMLLAASFLLTVLCIISICVRKKCNICLGICTQYFSLLLLLAAYKLMFWQFKISSYYLLGEIVLFSVVSLIVLKRFKDNKNGVKNKAMPIIALPTFTIASIIVKQIKDVNSNEVAVVFLSMCLVLLAFIFSIGVRYFVLDDSKMLFNTTL